MNTKAAAITATPAAAKLDEADLRAAEQLTEVYDQMTEQLGRVIVGQSEVLKQVLIAPVLPGPLHPRRRARPGQDAHDLQHRPAAVPELQRIQFTPDLMPSDITGTEILEEEEGTGRRRMRFVKGPIFGNIILGDEINRTPPKTQAALLQAMQEYKVTTAGMDLRAGEALPGAGHAEPDRAGRHLSAARGPARPLHVQDADRLSHLRGGADHRRDDDGAANCRRWRRCWTATASSAIQRTVRKVLIARLGDGLRGASWCGRRGPAGGGAGLREEVPDVGRRPAACQALLLGGKAHALLDGRVHVSTDDIRYVARPVLRHRLADQLPGGKRRRDGGPHRREAVPRGPRAGGQMNRQERPKERPRIHLKILLGVLGVFGGENNWAVMSQKYFDPEGLARVGHMELVARQVVEGFLTGRHRSPYHGFSVEYLDHRAYTPGDDPRTIDWKILARTDKYHVKLFEDETNLRAHILVDCSKSMAFQSGAASASSATPATSPPPWPT